MILPSYDGRSFEDVSLPGSSRHSLKMNKTSMDSFLPMDLRYASATTTPTSLSSSSSLAFHHLLLLL